MATVRPTAPFLGDLGWLPLDVSGLPWITYLDGDGPLQYVGEDAESIDWDEADWDGDEALYHAIASDSQPVGPNAPPAPLVMPSEDGFYFDDAESFDDDVPDDDGYNVQNANVVPPPVVTPTAPAAGGGLLPGKLTGDDVPKVNQGAHDYIRRIPPPQPIVVSPFLTSRAPDILEAAPAAAAVAKTSASETSAMVEAVGAVTAEPTLTDADREALLLLLASTL